MLKVALVTFNKNLNDSHLEEIADNMLHSEFFQVSEYSYINSTLYWHRRDNSNQQYGRSQYKYIHSVYKIKLCRSLDLPQYLRPWCSGYHKIKL